MQEIVNKAINSKINELVDQINTIAIAKITEIDKKKMLCTIKLIDKIEILGNKSEVAEIENVPIIPLFWNKNIKSASVYEVGDKVVVLFSQHSTFNARNSDTPTESDHNEKYSLNNAIVLGHIKKDGESNEKEKSWYVKFKDTLLEIKENKLSCSVKKNKIEIEEEKIIANIEKSTIEMQKEKITISTKDSELKSEKTVKVNCEGLNLTDKKKIEITTPKMEITTPKLEVTASGKFAVTAPKIEFNGNVTVNGKIKANDVEINAEKSLNAHIAKYNSHTHTSFAGGGTTTPPN